MKKLWIAGVLGLVLTISFPLNAADKVDLGTKPELLKRMKLVDTVASVESIDLQKRRVTIRKPDGVHVTTKVDESVPDLDKLKVGDEIKINYYESVTYQLVKVDPKETQKIQTVQTGNVSPPGKKPEIKEYTENTIIATIQAIDSQGRFVKMKGPEGDFSIPVRDPKNLEGIKVGDQVKITYAESLAVKVLKNK